MKTLERLRLESDLRARSSVARFGTLSISENYVQTSLPALSLAPRRAIVEADNCNHVGTGRDVQARFFGSGFDSICAACGALTTTDTEPV